MKKVFFLAIIILFSLVACKKYKTDDPFLYNKIITSNVIFVQNPLDSLEAYLIDLKTNSENDPKGLFILSNVDTILLSNLYYNVLKNNIIAKKNISLIELKSGDTIFKPVVLNSLNNIEHILVTYFRPLIDTIYASNKRNNLDLVYAILKNGKSGYMEYKATVDSMISAQQKFDAINKYVIGDKIIKFNF